MEAKCQCGRLTIETPGPSPFVVACHCTYCQRRSGSPFGALAYYPRDKVIISGEATRFERPTSTGGITETFFCPVCGSTMYVRVGKQPALLGVPVGAFTDPQFPAPNLSAWEESKHEWVVIPEPAEHQLKS